MELRYPLVLLIGASVVLILFFISFLIKPKKKKAYKNGRKIANTKLIKDTPFYKKLVIQYRVWLVIGRIGMVIMLIAGLLLIAQPHRYKVTTQVLYNRDIFICMDVSTSVDELNMELIKQFEDNPLGLAGEQVGISVFNTSSVLLVPLTSDYEYINSELELLRKGIEIRNDESSFGSDDYYAYYYVESGTLVGNENRGSSLIGDGLASCLFDFPENEDGERTQIVILTTDNEVAGEELITLTEACALAKERGIIVYGIAPVEPDDCMDSALNDMKAGVESTGGKFYVATNEKAVEEVFKDIKTREGSKFEKTDTYLQLLPFKPFILLLIGAGITAFSRKKVLG